MLMGYSTQHAGDVYRFLHMMTSHVIDSIEVQWLGGKWNELYSIPTNYCADVYFLSLSRIACPEHSNLFSRTFINVLKNFYS